MITREQFTAAAGAFYDLLASGSAPPRSSSTSGDGRAPKFDTSIARKGGRVQFASETDLAGLIFWKGRADEPPTDPKYVESNAKQSKALSYWIAYREANPDGAWTGERHRVTITARPPCAKPDTYERGEVQTPAQGGGPEASYTDADDGDIPF